MIDYIIVGRGKDLDKMDAIIEAYHKTNTNYQDKAIANRLQGDRQDTDGRD